MYCAPIPAHYLREMLGLENKLEIKPYNLFCFIFFLSSKSQVFLIFIRQKMSKESLLCDDSKIRQQFFRASLIKTVKDLEGRTQT